ncbi:DUF4126 domain-containing protein [Sphingomicrobium astaxanthinifaciens]|uniref:DUF4126 domain-containing protein n=1 Tax=Sphingomicrobium astaxanthinifaciens TaxID=1227949 RepID=UPI001FCA793C|nr:DUF4126 domain-containing protein [Sphingomicrobium astaxanthinifaciens]MCJ7421430.1 DUF4126 domain-containing protein [Sphingomicrobium astaxanthinifaciens]
MTPVLVLALALVAGLLNGPRTFAPVALVAWSAAFGWLDVAGTWLGWLGAPAPAALLTLLALGELYGDKVTTRSRTWLPGMIARAVMGALVGAGIALGASDPAPGGWGALLGALGALVGTPATLPLRLALARRLGRDLPAALIEDAIVIGGIAAIIALVA